MTGDDNGLELRVELREGYVFVWQGGLVETQADGDVRRRMSVRAFHDEAWLLGRPGPQKRVPGTIPRHHSP